VSNPYLFNGTANSGSISTTYVASTSLNGTLTENATMTTFTGTAEPSTVLNYNTAASLSAISGSWAGSLLDGTTATVTVDSNGGVKHTQ
jgi:hypothetical protein